MAEPIPPKNRTPVIIWSASCTLVVGAVIAGLILTGGPGHQRKLRMDSQRLSDLSTLRYEIANVYGQSKQVPNTLDKLPRHDPGFKKHLDDPVTGKPYVYRKTGPDSFELCAEFETASEETAPSRYGSYGPYDFPPHPAGPYCYRLTKQASPHADSHHFQIQGQM